ncbi:methyltransferase [Methanoregula sp.]|uniref:class I SAM-dependent methyltransferase n=1 Tax=Methanoregula sp. TaxID=2052170 RepID=UPI002375E5B6|nr:methyltransferase [Methanoregula sp.]MDD1686853.1 methyltransferase [Methanoregula sp.]
MRVRKIARADLPLISNAGWVDPARAPYIEGDVAWVPVHPGEPCDAEIPERRRYSGPGYYLMGDVAVIHGDKPSPADLEEIIRFRHPRGIIRIAELRDVTRTPETEILFGTCGEVLHKESGITYILDPQQVMFSMGNRNEKARMVAMIRSGSGTERVADMFAGIGYFTLPMAGAGANVHAMEINPVAFGYLERNIRKNRLTDRIIAMLGDCRTSLTGTYDRIVMGHFDALNMLPEALAHVKNGTILHLHTIGPADERIRAMVEGAGFSATIRVHKVKKYRPHAWHVVHDVTIS